MSHLSRLLLAIVILVVDALVFFVPLSGLFVAYVIIMNPPWVREFLNGLDAPPSGDAGG